MNRQWSFWSESAYAQYFCVKKEMNWGWVRFKILSEKRWTLEP